jgi:hypothetical protein
MEDLTNNEELQKMLTEFANDPNSEVKINSVVKNKQNQRAIRVQNLQALIHKRETKCSHGYKVKCDCEQKQPGSPGQSQFIICRRGSCSLYLKR